MKRSKNWRKSAELITKDELYAPLAAMRLVKQTATTKFDPTVDVAFVLGVDPRKADQMVRSTVNLPHGTGKTARVLVFAGGEKAEEARAAGADHVGADQRTVFIAEFLYVKQLPQPQQRGYRRPQVVRGNKRDTFE